MSVENHVISHYEQDGLAERILAQARPSAPDPEHLRAEDLAAFDEMHIGRRKASAYFFEAMQFAPGMRVLDIGSGMGGPARYAAENAGVSVTGIDLTPGFKDVAETLSAATGLGEQTEFVTGSALELPFDAGSFDAAYTIHVGMNIPDKAGVYGEAARVLKRGGVFGIYDVMAGKAGAIAYPLPWADNAGTSFLEAPENIAALLEAAGFEIVSREDRSAFGLTMLGRLLEHTSMQGNTAFMPKLENLISNIENGFCAPWQMICRKR